MNFPRLLLLPALAVMLNGCEKKPATNPEVIFLVLHENLRAFEKKDVDTVMATIHPESPVYESTRQSVEEMFKLVDLKFTLSDLRVVSSRPDEVKVSFVQKTERVGGSAPFTDNIVEGIHTLRPDKGTWKIYNTIQTKVTGLDGKPLTPPDAEPQTTITPPEKTPAASEPAPNAPPTEPPK
jgi:hypothetical protein